MIGTQSAAQPQPTSPINFTDFADLPDTGRPARKSVRPKVNRVPFRVTDLKRLLADRYGAHLPDNEDGRHHLLPHVHHLVLRFGPERARREALRLLPELSEREVAGMLADAAWWDDDELGVYLELTDADRTRLKITTIGGHDLLRPERLKRRKENRREADRARRAKAGAKPQAQSAEATRSWEQEGVSRRTWYRRRAGTDGTVSRPASLRGRAARVVPNFGTGGEASHHISTDRAESDVVPAKASPPTPASDTTRADSLKEAIRGEVSAEPAQNTDTTDADGAARLQFLRRREAWKLKREKQAAIVAARLREGIEIGTGERILLDRVEKERQERAEVGRRQQEAQRQADPVYQRMMARKHANTIEAVRQGLLPASILERPAA